MVDLTFKVPDEVWCQVFRYISSTSHKFKVAAVNRKFRRCIMTLLEKPMALEFNFRSRDHELLNGCRIHQANWAMAVKVLAEKTEFDSITWLDCCPWDTHDGPRVMEPILLILIEADCLGQVASFKSQAATIYCHSDRFESFLAHCAKLSVLELGCPLGSWLRGIHLRIYQLRPNLSVALNNKALTELSLRLQYNDLTIVSEVFRALVPHKLRKVRLILNRVDLAELARDLGNSAWSVLEEIHLHSTAIFPDFGRLTVALLTSLPMLHRCHLTKGFHPQELGGWFVPAVLTVLEQSNRTTKVAVVCEDKSRIKLLSGCRMIHIAHQLRAQQPALQFDFDQDAYLKFELNNVSLCLHVNYGNCDNADCIGCHSFYPNVLRRLAQLAQTVTDGHLENHQLGRCKVKRVVADLNRQSNGVFEATEDQNLVTITLIDNATGDRFYLRVESGQCLIPCLRCFMIEH